MKSGNTIKRLRLDSKMTLSDLSKNTKIQITNLSLIENNKRDISPEMLRKILGAILGNSEGDKTWIKEMHMWALKQAGFSQNRNIDTGDLQDDFLSPEENFIDACMKLGISKSASNKLLKIAELEK